MEKFCWLRIRKMRLHIIILLLLLIFTTGCRTSEKETSIDLKPEDKAVESYSDSKEKLIEIESELAPQRGIAQICVYNDDFVDDGVKIKYTFIDIIKDNENKETINTHCLFSEITDIDCFDINRDNIKDIAIIGKSSSYTTIFLCESFFNTYDYYSCLFYGDSIQKALGNDFSMNELKTTLSKDGRDGNLAKIVISDAENNTYSDYKSAYISFLKVLEDCGVDEDGIPVGCYSIYDINKDSTPELIVNCWDYERVYTFSDGKVYYVDEFCANHSQLLAYPSGNGIIMAGAWMGSEWVELYSLKNNKLTSKELYGGSTTYEDPETGDFDVKYTPIEDVVPDAYDLSSFSPADVLPIEKYED